MTCDTQKSLELQSTVWKRARKTEQQCKPWDIDENPRKRRAKLLNSCGTEIRCIGPKVGTMTPHTMQELAPSVLCEGFW